MDQWIVTAVSIQKMQVMKQSLLNQEKINALAKQDKTLYQHDKKLNKQDKSLFKQRISSIEKRLYNPWLSLYSYQEITASFLNSYNQNKGNPDITPHQKGKIAQGTVTAHSCNRKINTEL